MRLITPFVVAVTLAVGACSSGASGPQGPAAETAAAPPSPAQSAGPAASPRGGSNGSPAIAPGSCADTDLLAEFRPPSNALKVVDAVSEPAAALGMVIGPPMVGRLCSPLAKDQAHALMADHGGADFAAARNADGGLVDAGAPARDSAGGACLLRPLTNPDGSTTDYWPEAAAKWRAIADAERAMGDTKTAQSDDFLADKALEIWSKVMASQASGDGTGGIKTEIQIARQLAMLGGNAETISAALSKARDLAEQRAKAALESVQCTPALGQIQDAISAIRLAVLLGADADRDGLTTAMTSAIDATIRLNAENPDVDRSSLAQLASLLGLQHLADQLLNDRPVDPPETCGGGDATGCGSCCVPNGRPECQAPANLEPGPRATPSPLPCSAMLDRTSIA